VTTALLVAFAAGFLARAIGLPALVGYLVAGFGLHAAGFEADATLDTISDLGILLLLFGIGLKLRLRTLTRPMVWGTELVFALAGTGLVTGTLLALGSAGLAVADGLSLTQAATIGLALSFSSTVFAVQALDARGESGSLQGRVSISILVLQDLVAVGYLVLADGKAPSPWALLLIPGFVIGRRLAMWLLDRSGHGEVLVLLGFALAVGVGAGSFALVDLKADLGALVAGLLLSGHPRAGELAERLLGFKDLLLIGFFLSIGLGGAPSAEAWVIGVVAVLLMPTRSAVLFLLFTRFGLRSRTAFHASLTLSTYSEFGLIVAAAATASGTLDAEWVSIIGVAVAASLVVTSAANATRYRLFARFGRRMQGFERAEPIPEDAILDFGDARIVVFGMGRVGTGAYERFEERLGPCVVGIDRSDETVEAQQALGRRVIRGDALDRDFWERVRFHPDIELVVAAMSSHRANVECASRVKEFLPHTTIASIAMHPDQVTSLQDAGVNVARNLYEEAGQGLADDAIVMVEE
jgi:predicted Kef-type K+ transport protein